MIFSITTAIAAALTQVIPVERLTSRRQITYRTMEMYLQVSQRICPSTEITPWILR